MPILMLSRLGHALPRFVPVASVASVAGDSLQERLRSSTIALAGLVTAVGLVLVGIAANQGWPDFVDSPIPGSSTERAGEAGVAPGAFHTGLGRAAGHGSPATTRHARPESGSGRASETRLSPQRQLVVPAPETQNPAPAPAPSGTGEAAAPGAPAGSAPGEPPASAAPQPVESPPPAAPAPSPVVVPVPTSAGPGHGKAKGHEKSHGPSSSTVAPAPAAPSEPPAPVEAPAEAPEPAAEGPGNGHGHAYGHDK